MKIIRIALILGIAVILYVLTSRLFLNEGSFLELEEIISDQVIQIPEDRIWLSTNLKSIVLDPDISDSLLRPITIKNYDDTLYVSDYGDMKIKRFTYKGDYIDSFGEMIGRGPEDFTQIMDFTVSGNKLYALDLQTMMIKVFDKNSKKSITSIPTKYRAMRVTSANGFQIVNSLSDYDLFNIYNNQDSLILSFGELVEDQMMNPLSLTGEIIPSNQDSIFIFVPNFASYIFYYGLDGILKKSIQTIDRIPFPGTEKSADGNGNPRFSAPNSTQRTQAIARSQEYLFIQISRQGTKNNQGKIVMQPYSFIDIYTIYGDKYIASFKLPYFTDDIAINNHYLYSISQETGKIEAYELPKF